MKKLWPVVAQINDLEERHQAALGRAVAAKTVEFRARIAAGSKESRTRTR
jgi:preprotein translocase subunit SecA